MFKNEAFTVVRAPLDPSTGKEIEDCRYALFPGLALARSEPELIVLLYDSLRYQRPDTAMFLYQGRDGADPLLNRKWSERLLTRWRNLGKPTLIVVSPEDMKFLRGVVGEIPTVSVYDQLLSFGISGGCNRELYRLTEPEGSSFGPSVAELAESMGVVLYRPEESGGTEPGGAGPDGGAGPEGTKPDGGPDGPPDISPSEATRIPFLTSSIDLRNSLIKRGFDAVHILELVYGMGPSNRHLAHSHEGEHDHDKAPGLRDVSMSPEELAAREELFSPSARSRNLQELHDTLLSFFWNE